MFVYFHKYQLIQETIQTQDYCGRKYYDVKIHKIITDKKKFSFI